MNPTKSERRLVVHMTLLIATGLFLASAGRAQNTAPIDLTEMKLEDLMNVKVTSVSKREQKLSRTAAAVFVINQEDIRRSGATNIPDLLRMAPGVDVAQIDASVWAISIRGFTDRYGDKVLVLIDGRSVFTPTTSGVNWDQQDVPLEDIDRIEVIRGPRGTVWGANAVNGVINIITKSAKTTPGGLVRAGAGSQEAAQGLVQYGGTIGPGAWRVFGSYATAGNSPSPENNAADGGHNSHLGFRSDWTLSPQDTATVQGDLFKAREGHLISTVLTDQMFREDTFNDKTTVTAGDILGRWNHILLNGSDTSLQIYYDRNKRLDRGLGETRDTIDVDFQHHFISGSRHDVVWGLGYRFTTDGFTPGYQVRYVPSHRADSLFSTFAQDEIRLSNSLWFTLGSKFEHNNYTGFEYEPSARLVWTPTSRQTVWWSASRAIRQPA